MILKLNILMLVTCFAGETVATTAAPTICQGTNDELCDASGKSFPGDCCLTTGTDEDLEYPYMQFCTACCGQPCLTAGSVQPSASPATSEPTLNPTLSPTSSYPTLSPSESPTTSSPTISPTKSPTLSDPTLSPSVSPTSSTPTDSPTGSPTSAEPSSHPSANPTSSIPTTSPTEVPSWSPTLLPTVCGANLASSEFCSSIANSDCCARESEWIVCRATCCEIDCAPFTAAPSGTPYDGFSMTLDTYSGASSCEDLQSQFQPQLEGEREIIKAGARLYISTHTDIQLDDINRIDIGCSNDGTERVVILVAIHHGELDSSELVDAIDALPTSVSGGRLLLIVGTNLEQVVVVDVVSIVVGLTDSPTSSPTPCATSDASFCIDHPSIPGDCCTNTTLKSSCVACCGHFCSGGSSAPSISPTISPTTSTPSFSPTVSPTVSPTQSPSSSTPSLTPTTSPTESEPTVSPSESPTTSSPTLSPTISPTSSYPTSSPSTSEPTTAPTGCLDNVNSIGFDLLCAGISPSDCVLGSSYAVLCPLTCCQFYPTVSPTSSPTASTPTSRPTSFPTQFPSAAPSISSPSASPTFSPTTSPTFVPSFAPTRIPSNLPTTSRPTASPTVSPTTSEPTISPTVAPTSSDPTESPTSSMPTEYPTAYPTTSAPSMSPTNLPTTGNPTLMPTSLPTFSDPTASPTLFPSTSSPTSSPTVSPTVSNPTDSPSLSPTTSEPTRFPTKYPTSSPSNNPTANPTSVPSYSPTPSDPPTRSPTYAPSTSPTSSPSRAPTTGFEQRTITGSHNLSTIDGNLNQSQLEAIGCSLRAFLEAPPLNFGPDAFALANITGEVSGRQVYCGIYIEIISVVLSGDQRKRSGTTIYSIITEVLLAQLSKGGPTALDVSSALAALEAGYPGTVDAWPLNDLLELASTYDASVLCSVRTDLTLESDFCPVGCTGYINLERAFQRAGWSCEEEVRDNGILDYQGRINFEEVCDICPRSCCYVLFPRTLSPSTAPSYSPTESPTLSPSASPTVSPTKIPTESPTVSPTLSPSVSAPSNLPTFFPTSSNPTTTPSVSPTRSPTITLCDRDLDVVFVLDESRSVNITEFGLMKDFVKRFIDFYVWEDEISLHSPTRQGTRVGLVSFSGSGEYPGSARTHFQLGQRTSGFGVGVQWTKDRVKAYIDALDQDDGSGSGTTHTDKGLEHAICLLNRTFASRIYDFECNFTGFCGTNIGFNNGVCRDPEVLVTFDGTTLNYPSNHPDELNSPQANLQSVRERTEQIHKVVIVLTDGAPGNQGAVPHVEPTRHAAHMIRTEVGAKLHLIEIGLQGPENLAERTILRDIFDIASYPQDVTIFDDYANIDAQAIAEELCPECAADRFTDCPIRISQAALGCYDPEAEGCNTTCCLTDAPTTSPSISPTISPTFFPTLSPITSDPSVSPTKSPSTSIPTVSPTKTPTTSEPSTSPTISPTISPTKDFCRHPLDLVFLLDASSTITQENFARLKEFIKRVATEDDFFIHSSLGTPTQISISTFAHPGEIQYYPRVEFPLGSYSKQEIRDNIDAIPYFGGLTFITPALDMVRPSAQGNPVNYRTPQPEGVKRVLAIITDGLFTDFRVNFSTPEAYETLGYEGFPGYMRQSSDEWSSNNGLRWPPCEGCETNSSSFACTGGVGWPYSLPDLGNSLKSFEGKCYDFCAYKRALNDDNVFVFGIPLLDATSSTSLWTLPVMADNSYDLGTESLTESNDFGSALSSDAIATFQRRICEIPDVESVSTCNETQSPTTSPTAAPSAPPTSAPSRQPTVPPTPISPAPSTTPTSYPSLQPTSDPTESPNPAPTGYPSTVPTKNPTSLPSTTEPTPNPTEVPSHSPTASPTIAPTANPTVALPTVSPTETPSKSPTLSPTSSPSPLRSQRSCGALIDEVLPRSRSPKFGYYFRDPAGDVCGASNVAGLCWGSSSSTNVHYSDASEICGASGGRLCSASEVEAGFVKGTGCNLDNRLVWTSTNCEFSFDPLCVDGKAVRLGDGSFTAQNIVENKFAVRCCADFEPSDIVTTPDPSVIRSEKSCIMLQRDSSDWNKPFVYKEGQDDICAASAIDDRCHRSTIDDTHNYTQALQVCESVGARLCTSEELLNGFARGTGCAIDRALTWTSSECSTGFRTTVYGAGRAFSDDTACHAMNGSASVRCCGDAQIYTGGAAGGDLITSTDEFETDSDSELSSSSLSGIISGLVTVLIMAIVLVIIAYKRKQRMNQHQLSDGGDIAAPKQVAGQNAWGVISAGQQL